MLVEVRQRDIQVVDNPLARIKAKVFNDPKVMERMIRPYTDLELAAVREVIQNAADASLTIDVHAPNMLNPTVKIRDYGAGMSLDFLITTYNSVGESTKSKANAVVIDGVTQELQGHGGIGRYSPFCVTDQFFVRSWHNGMLTVASVYLDDTYTPTTDIVSHTPSSDPSGVEVSFTPDTKQVGRIVDALNEVLSWMPSEYTINVSGNPDVRRKSIFDEAKLSGDGWWVFDRGRECRVLMGRIPFTCTNFYAPGLVFRVPMGSVGINDAREQAVNDSRLQTEYDAAMERMTQEVKADIEAKVAACTTEWEARAEFDKATDLARSVNHIANLPNTIKWNGKDITAQLHLTTSIVGCSRYNTSTRYTSFRHQMFNHVDPAHTKVVVNDVKTKDAPRRRVYEYWKLQGWSRNFGYLWLDNDATLADKLKELGDPPTIPISSMPAVASIPKSSTIVNVAATTPVQFRVWNSTYKQFERTDKTIDLAQPAYYIKLLENIPQLQAPFQVITVTNIIRLLSILNTGTTGLPVYGVPGTFWKRVDNAPAMVDLQAYLATKLKEYIDNNRGTVEKALAFDTYPTTNTYPYVSVASIVGVQEYFGVPDYANKASWFVDVCKLADPTLQPCAKTTAELDKLVVDKPLLVHLNNNAIPSNLVIDYIKS